MGSLAPRGSNFLSDFRLEEETRSGNLFNQVAEQVSLHLSRQLCETAVTQTCHQLFAHVYRNEWRLCNQQGNVCIYVSFAAYLLILSVTVTSHRLYLEEINT